MIYSDHSGFWGHKIVRQQKKRHRDWLAIVVIQEIGIVTYIGRLSKKMVKSGRVKIHFEDATVRLADN